MKDSVSSVGGTSFATRPNHVGDLGKAVVVSILQARRMGLQGLGQSYDCLVY